MLCLHLVRSMSDDYSRMMSKYADDDDDGFIGWDPTYVPNMDVALVFVEPVVRDALPDVTNVTNASIQCPQVLLRFPIADDVHLVQQHWLELRVGKCYAATGCNVGYILSPYDSPGSFRVKKL
eukprot:TRINITY_DN19074_c0_g1_i1.p2 TRINITY_DN19074_c0_g1~~TRINITY_DN19074_c0_g1_i1.p2  ORF type:complete len:123 (-),score=6.90 TRINITY_DN19074_c0_g1_i1:149-517(-)